MPSRVLTVEMFALELNQPDTAHHVVHRVDRVLCFPYYRMVDGPMIWISCLRVTLVSGDESFDAGHAFQEQFQSKYPSSHWVRCTPVEKAHWCRDSN